MENKVKFILNVRTLSFLIFLLLVCICVYAQEQPKITLQLLKDEDLKLPEQFVKIMFFMKDQQTEQGFLLESDGKLKISIADRPLKVLPYHLETLLSVDGQTILQYGDELDMSHPSRTNLYWVGNNGEILSSVVNYYRERARVSMSNDGFTIIAGGLVNQDNKQAASLYSPAGEKIWELALSAEQRAANIAVGSGGTHSILVTTNNVKWLEDHQLHILDEKGQIQNSLTDFKVIQKVTIVDEGQHLFVQGYDNYGLVRIADSRLLWVNKGKIRMISPDGAKMSPSGDLLFTLIADFDGKPKRQYRWNLQIYNTTDGNKVQSIWLPDEYPGTWDRVFEQISTDRIQIITGQKRINYSWQIEGR